MSEREWRFYIDDMIRFSEKVLAYTENLDRYPAIPWRQVVATRNRLIHGIWGLTTISSGVLLKGIFLLCLMILGYSGATSAYE